MSLSIPRFGCAAHTPATAKSDRTKASQPVAGTRASDRVTFGNVTEADPVESQPVAAPSFMDKCKAGAKLGWKSAFIPKELGKDALWGAIFTAVTFPIFHVFSPGFVPLFMGGHALYRGVMGFVDGYRHAGQSEPAASEG